MTEHITASEFRKMNAKGRKPKYGNQRITIDGRTYDSVAEAKYGEALILREKAGEVTAVERQRPFPLIVGNGYVVGKYLADFCFFDHVEDRFRVVDVKGAPATAVFKLKAKMVKALYGFDVEVVQA